MLDVYKILTITHRQTNVSHISDFVIKYDDKAALTLQLQQLKATFDFSELMYLQTCNRVMYFFVAKKNIDQTFKNDFFATINPNLSSEQIQHSVASYQGTEALKHLLSVASSTDSMVVGEREILRQLREAYEASRIDQLVGDDIRLAVDTAVLASKSVYSNTRIGEKPVSVASLAAQRLLYFHLPKHARILMIGAGQTNMLVAKFLSKYHFDNVTICNRSLERAQALANTLQGKAIDFNALAQYEAGFDAMIVCTGATTPLIDEALYQQLLGNDSHRKLVIDLSIPNNVDKSFLPNYNVEYVEVEDIRAMAQENLAFRQTEVQKATEILDQYLAEFPSLYSQRKIEIAMRTVPEEIKAIKEHAINSVFKHEVESLDEHTRHLLERMMTYMEKRCIGTPMKAAREAVLY
ncbi:MAG: glutamyl-tRNA reductase [Saprospiraceae bacterium]|nr:glutamyl-tRNA reductase [Saprospiraceae bacterium]